MGVSAIDGNMREARLRWFGHVTHRDPGAQVRRCEFIEVPESRRGRGRPKKNWDEVIRHDMTQLGLTTDMSLDRAL